MTRTVDYFMVPNSPWTWLGHDRFVEITRRHGATVVVKPFDLGRVFPLSGGLPLPKRAPQRQAYRLVELARWSRHLGVPLTVQPRFFPVNGEPASLMILAARDAGGDAAALRMAGAALRAVWVDERDIADPATLVAIADAAGLDGGALATAAQSPACRAGYDRLTDEAIAAQVFGVPWYRYRDEPFWGQDRLDFLDRALAGA